MTDIPIDLHTHCTGGIADMIYMKAVEAGVDIIDTAISPLVVEQVNLQQNHFL